MHLFLACDKITVYGGNFMSIYYVASYGKKEKKGIYLISFEGEKLSFVKHIVTDDFPSYLVRRNNTLYSSFKNAARDNEGGGIGSYSIIDNDLLCNQNYCSSGRSYTHLCLNEQGNYLFAANYHAGATASYELVNNEIIYKIGAIHHSGLGPDLLRRQLSAHVHYVGITPDKEYVYAVDLGSDRVVMYHYEHGILEEDTQATLHLEPGSGPRHMIFSDDGNFAYVVNEIRNSVCVYQYNHGYQFLQELDTLPGDYKKDSSASAIKLSASNNYLFISNRGHDSISLYARNKDTGLLTFVSHTKVGACPRDIYVTEDNYILVGAQENNCIEAYYFDEDHKVIDSLNQSLEIPQPVCIIK